MARNRTLLVLDGGTETDSLDGGPHVTGDQCVNGEALVECEVTGAARAAPKSVSARGGRLGRAFLATGAALRP